MNDEYMSSAEIRAKIAELKIKLAFQLEFEEELEKTLDECKEMDPELEKTIKDSEEEILRKIAVETKKRARAGRRRKGRVLAWKVVAIAAILLTVSVGSALATVRMVEAGILKLDIRAQENNTIFRLVGTDNALKVPIGWEGEYYPSYIPEGYEVKYIDEFGVHYADGKGGTLQFDENMYGVREAADTEDAAVSKAMINGTEATIVEKDGWATVFWLMDDRYFVVRTNESRETALWIADSVERIE